MKELLYSALFLVSLCLSVNTQAQIWLSEVTLEPDTPIACRSTEVKIEGFLPATNYEIDSTSILISGDSILITLNAGFIGFGFPGAIPFDHYVTVDTIPKGLYTLEVSYSLDDSLVEQFTRPFFVKTCCNHEPENLLYVDEFDGFILKWDAVPYSQACQIRGRLDGTSSWLGAAPIVEDEPNKFFISDNRLISGANYEWQVRCACSLSPLTGTDWSMTGVFFVP